jgi:hypothetical protein
MIEKYIMNYFDSESQYAGRMHLGEFVNNWRRTFSLDVTSTKVFEWQGDEEWKQLNEEPDDA